MSLLEILGLQPPGSPATGETAAPPKKQVRFEEVPHEGAEDEEEEEEDAEAA